MSNSIQSKPQNSGSTAAALTETLQDDVKALKEAEQSGQGLWEAYGQLLVDFVMGLSQTGINPLAAPPAGSDLGQDLASLGDVGSFFSGLDASSASDAHLLDTINSTPNALPADPPANSTHKLLLGGGEFLGVAQYKNGGLSVSQDGTSISASIDENSVDGCIQESSDIRRRNELGVLGMTGHGTLSFDLNASGPFDSKRTTNILQIKPQGKGGDNAELQIGVKDGELTYSLPGEDSVKTGLSAKNAHIELKMNPNGESSLIINGKPITNFSVADPQGTYVKFGIEGLTDNVHGKLFANYTNINFSRDN